MIITCPNCHTRYDVTNWSIGPSGRKVQCANCHRSWHARPEMEEELAQVVGGVSTDAGPAAPPPPRDQMFGAEAEEELDQDFQREEAAARAAVRAKDAAYKEPTDADNETHTEDPALLRQRQRAMVKRQQRVTDRLPYARIRRLTRVGSVTILGVFLACAVFLRTDIVRVWPDLGGLYASIGLGVNVVGLDFDHVTTLRQLRDGRDVLVIRADIYNVAGGSVAVPNVLVNLKDAQGQTIYQWNARPQAQIIGPGEIFKFETKLSSAPTDAKSVQLVFAGTNTGEDSRAKAQNWN